MFQQRPNGTQRGLACTGNALPTGASDERPLMLPWTDCQGARTKRLKLSPRLKLRTTFSENHVSMSEIGRGPYYAPPAGRFLGVRAA